MNHHYFLDQKLEPDKRKLPRVDRLFELHEKSWFTRKEIEASAEYYKWLQQPHPFPIYTVQCYEEIPSCLVFPRDDLQPDLFGHLWRGLKNDQEFYTSSVSLMLGLAIHERFSRIELYGIEMASQTEFADQKPGCLFMLGMALGRGIDVVLHPVSRLLEAKVYGYEGVPYVMRSRLEELKVHYTALYDQKAYACERITRAFNQNANPSEAEKREAMEANGWKGLYFGAKEFLRIILEDKDAFLSAQILEGKETLYQANQERFKGDANMTKARADVYFSERMTEKAMKQWQLYQDQRVTMFAHLGAIQVIQKLRAECRLEKPDHHLDYAILE